MSANIFLLGGKYFLFSFVSKYGHDNAETDVVVVAIVVVEIERPGIRTVIVIATTHEERIARSREVRVIV